MNLQTVGMVQESAWRPLWWAESLNLPRGWEKKVPEIAQTILGIEGAS